MAAFTDYRALDFSGLNSSIDQLGKKVRDDKASAALLAAFDQSQVSGGQASPLTALGQPLGASPIIPVQSSPIAPPSTPRAPQVAESEADTQRLEADMERGVGAFAPQKPPAPQGNPDIARLFSTKENEFGLPPGYLSKTAMVESRGNPNAQNPNSSAGGLFQFIDGTAAQYGLRNKFDPVASTDAAARFAADNKRVLAGALGREPTAGELYLAHQQGAGGAVKLLRNPNAPVEQLVGPEAARLNGGAGLTAAQFASKWTSKIDGQGAQTAQADMPASGSAEAQGFAIPGGGQPQPATRQNVSNQMIRTLLANPDTRQMGLALWQQALTGKQFGFQVVGDQLYRTNPSTGQVEPVAGVQKPVAPVAVSEGQTLVDPRTGQVVFQGAAKPRAPVSVAEGGTLVNPDTGQVVYRGPVGGKQEQEIAARERIADQRGLQGDAREAFVYNGRVPVGAEKTTEGQANAALYADRMKEAEAVFAKPGMTEAAMSRMQQGMAQIPGFGNSLVSPEFQQVDQAQRNFINATLRRESGAVISDAEFDNARKQYFPQPGDKPEVLAQKARNRQTAIQGIGNAAGPNYAKRSAAPAPSLQGARVAPDGNTYVPDPNRPGKYLMVQP